MDPIGAMETAAFDRAGAIAFAHWFGLQPATARVLMALYRACGAPMSAERLADAAGATAHTVRTHHLHVLRQALDGEAIDRRPIAGYLLTEDGLAECRAALRTLREDLRGAG